MPIITIQMCGGEVQNVECIPPLITIRIQSEAELKEFTAPPSALPVPRRHFATGPKLCGTRVSSCH
jgi:hypothetical protein